MMLRRADRTESEAGAQAFGLTSLQMLAGIAALSVLGLAVIAPLLAQSVDRHERSREACMVKSAIEQLRQDMLARVGSDAHWDPALSNLANRFDEHWAEENLTSRTGSDLTSRLVTVTDPSDRLVFVRNRGARVPAVVADEARRSLDSIVRTLRSTEAIRTGAGAAPSLHSAADWILGSDIVLLDGRPKMVVASLVGGDTGQVRPNSPKAAVLAYWSDIRTDMLPDLTSRFLLRDASIDAADGTGARDGIMLRSASGKSLAALTWVAEAPGRQLLLQAMPPLALVVAVFGVTVIFAYRNAVAGSRALRRSQAETHHLAFHDGLTGLPNRRLFADRLERALARGERQGPENALLLLDLDRFKIVNDTYGHQSGDELLQEVARRLSKICGDEHTCARLGGDEFVILAAGTGAAAAAALAKKVSAALAPPVEVAGRWVNGNASIGISISHEAPCLAADLLRQADIALYKAKEQARGSFRFFEVEMDHALLDRAELGVALLQALAQGGLDVVYQPQYENGRMVGVEALTRWNHPQRGMIPPSFFIPLAEEHGQIDRLSDMTIPKIFADSRSWPHLTVAINLSASQLHLPNFLSKLDGMVRRFAVDPAMIELEITENVLMTDVGGIQQILSELHARGFRLVLDDFGTGYSSLGYLSRFKVDRIKIDRSFVGGLPLDGRSVSIVGAILALAEALDISVIAEGVETNEQMQELTRLGCKAVQGFLLGCPVSSDAISLLQSIDNITS